MKKLFQEEIFEVKSKVCLFNLTTNDHQSLLNEIILQVEREGKLIFKLSSDGKFIGHFEGKVSTNKFFDRVNLQNELNSACLENFFQLLSIYTSTSLENFSLCAQKLCPALPTCAHLASAKRIVKYNNEHNTAKHKLKNVIELIFVLFTEHFYNVFHERTERKKKKFMQKFIDFFLRGTLRYLSGCYEREGKGREEEEMNICIRL